MKSYSGKGIFNKSLAKLRREFRDITPPCPAWRDDLGHWHSERDLAMARELARGTGGGLEVRYFVGSAEDYLDGKPEIHETLTREP